MTKNSVGGSHIINSSIHQFINFFFILPRILKLLAPNVTKTIIIIIIILYVNLPQFI